MKLAWICYPTKYLDEGDDYDDSPEILFSEPDGWKYDRVVQIVYAEIKG